MKKLIFAIVLMITSFVAFSQEQPNPPVLHNQFRDYVEFSKRQERPVVEHRDGKVIIIMSEEQFFHLKQMRMNNFHHGMEHRRPMICEKCGKKEMFENHQKFMSPPKKW